MILSAWPWYRELYHSRRKQTSRQLSQETAVDLFDSSSCCSLANDGVSSSVDQSRRLNRQSVDTSSSWCRWRYLSVLIEAMQSLREGFRSNAL